MFELAEADPRATISHIKEKYGGLRIDLVHDSVGSELLRVIDEVEAQSEAICEACGSPACTVETTGGRILTLCDTHLLDGARILPPEVPLLEQVEEP